MASQRFCLRWNNHQSNLLSVFDQLLHAETFTDVTLAVEGQYLKAHKMVLSACSPYFNALFVNHPEKHPIVILKDVPYSDMKSLLDFMYRGEVSVDQERLTAFLKVAESLRIKGLTEVNDDKPGGGRSTTPPPSQVQRIQPYLVQQRNKSVSMVNMNNTSSLLGSALCGQKRKRGRPRKLSGSSNGTGNDYDDFERDNVVQGSPEMMEVKMGTEIYSGNEGSDDNLRDSGDNSQERESEHMDINESRNNQQSRSKDTSMEKDNDNNSDQNDSDDQMDSSYMEPQLMLDEYDEPVEFKYDPNTDSTNLQETIPTQHQETMYLATQQQKKHMPAGVGVAKGGAVIGAGSNPGTVTILNSMVGIPKLTPIVKSIKQMPKLAKRPKVKQNGLSKTEQQPLNNNDFIDVFGSNFLATGGQKGSSFATALVQPQWGQNQSSGGSGNLKSRSSTGSVDNMGNNINVNNSPELSQRLFGVSKPIVHQIVPEILDPMKHLPTALGLRIRVNPLTTGGITLNQLKNNDSLNNNSSTVQNDDFSSIKETTHNNDTQDKPNEKPSSPSNSEHFHHKYKASNSATKHDSNENSDERHDDEGQFTATDLGADVTLDCSMSPTTAPTTDTTLTTTPTVQKPQRRRIRRKAQSTIDDQAEHLTEMSVRGLDLFRYASITEGVYRCTECAKENVQKTFKNKYSFQRHAFLYHEGKHRKVFPCPLCGKEFSRPDKMKNHMKTTHECFVPKDPVNYHPLNYLISAAAAGEFAQMYPHLDNNSSSGTGTQHDDDTTVKAEPMYDIGATTNSNNATSIKALKETEKV